MVKIEEHPLFVGNPCACSYNILPMCIYWQYIVYILSIYCKNMHSEGICRGVGFLRYLQGVGFLRYLQGVNMFLPSGCKHYDPYVVNQLKSPNPRLGHLPTQLVSPPGVGPGHQQPFWIWVSVVTTVGVLDKHISDFSYLGTHLLISSEKPHKQDFF